MNTLRCQTQQRQPALHLDGDRKILALLLVQLEETEEQIDGLEQFRTALLLDRITAQIFSLNSTRRVRQIAGSGSQYRRIYLSPLTPEATDADAWDTLRTVERQNNRLSRLVHDLLLLPRMDLQGFSAKQESCNLND